MVLSSWCRIQSTDCSMSTKKRLPLSTASGPVLARRPASAVAPVSHAAAALSTMPAAAAPSPSSSGASTPMQLPTPAPAAPAPLIPLGSTSPSSLCYTSLLLLGFDAPALTKRFAPVEIGPAMFDKQQSGNIKGMQILLHFLLLKIKQCSISEAHNSSAEWKEVATVFQHSFPCLDRTQARDFLTCALGCLLGFEKGAGQVFPPGTIRKSHFATPAGERMNVIFWHLSSYALQCTMHALYPIQYSTLPAFTLPSLADAPILFPHLLKALKTHVSRQSGMVQEKMKQWEQAEEEWRHHAEYLTTQVASLQSQLSSLQPPAKPRVPGEKSAAQVEAELTQQLLDPRAEAGRRESMQMIRTAHARLHTLFSKFQRERERLNEVMDGVWKGKNLDRAALEKLLEVNTASNQNDDGAARVPLNLATIVAEWNDSLLKMQGVLSQYLQQQPATGADAKNGGASEYLTALQSTSSSLSSSLRSHSTSLVGLRSLTSEVRSQLVPRLKDELRRLQREMRERGMYAGPVIKGDRHDSQHQQQAPSLIPPTPARSSFAPNLAVPATPMVVHGGLTRASVQQTPAQFHRSSNPSLRSSSSTVTHGYPLPSTTTSSTLPSSVRRAALGRAAGRERERERAEQQQQREGRMERIVDYGEEQFHPQSSTSSSYRPHHSVHRSVHFSPEVEEKYQDPSTTEAVTSPQGYLSSAATDGISPLATKKLVFSPQTNSATSTPPSAGGAASNANGSSMAARASSVRSTDSVTGRESFSPVGAGNVTSSSVRSRFVSPSSSSHPSAAAGRTVLSPSNPMMYDEEGLLGADELYYEEDPASPAEQAAAAKFADAHEHTDDDDEEDDEVVFSTGDASSRRSSAQTTTSVDPNAPTPVAARTTRHFAPAATSTPQYPRSSGGGGAKAAISRLMSPSYGWGSQGGLLDEDEDD
jgi:hypothetical protein